MSVEDYELMHRLMKQDKERSERVNEVSLTVWKLEYRPFLKVNSTKPISRRCPSSIITASTIRC